MFIIPDKNNPPPIWAEMVGSLIINCGAIEFLSFRWIDALSTDRILRDVAIDLEFSDRIKLVKKLIARSAWTNERK